MIEYGRFRPRQTPPLLSQERFDGLSVLLNSHSELLPLRLELLRSVPETTPPSLFSSILSPLASSGGEGLAEWLCSRAREIDQRSGALDNAEALLELGEGWGVGGGVSSLLQLTRQLSIIVYSLGGEGGLAEFEALSPQQRLRALFIHAPAEPKPPAFDEFCGGYAVPFLRLQPESEWLLRDYAVRSPPFPVSPPAPTSHHSPHVTFTHASLSHINARPVPPPIS